MESKLHRISDGGPSPRAAVVFVHGLGGDAFDTWKTGEAEEDTWPHWLGQDLPDVRVYSLGYDVSPSAWLGSAMPIVDRATNALSHFELEDSLRRLPTIFICHSLGGLLVKEALRQAETLYNQPWKELIARTRGMVFLATPHTGARLANYVTGLGTLLGLRPGVNLDELKANEPALRGLNTWYAQNVGRLGIKNLVFFETRATKGIHIVDQTSANPGLVGAIPRPIDANHFQICKPTSRDTMMYQLVKSFVEECVAASPTGSSGRIDYTGVIAKHDALMGRKWVFREIADWLSNPDGPRFLMLTGVPGTGKSAIAVQLYHFSQGEKPEPPDRLQNLQQGFLSAIHFCKARPRELISPQAFAESLAEQLPSGFPAFNDALEKENSRGPVASADAFRRLVIIPLRAMGTRKSG